MSALDKLDDIKAELKADYSDANEALEKEWTEERQKRSDYLYEAIGAIESAMEFLREV